MIAMVTGDKEKYFKFWEKELYDKFSDNDAIQNYDFEAIAIGFFIGKGLDLSESIDLYQYCITKGKF